MKTTASGLERTLACIGPEFLPSIREEANEHMVIGTARHAFFEDMTTMGRDAALARVPHEYREAFALIDASKLPTHVAAEVAFVYDVNSDTAREVGRGIGRNYGTLGEWEIAGTADAVGVSDDAVYVGDLKGPYSELTPAGRNPQVLLLALAAARVYGRDAAHVELIRIREDGTPVPDRAVLDAFDLDAFAAELRRLKGRIEAGRRAGVPDLTEGRQCEGCPCFRACPAKVSLIRAVATDMNIYEPGGGPITPENARRAYEAYRAIKSALGHVGEQLHAYARHAPIVLEDGKVFGPVETTRESFDGAIARDALAATFGPGLAELAVEPTVTKKSIERALRIVHPEEKQAPLMRKAVEAIRGAGGAETKSSITIKEYAP